MTETFAEGRALTEALTQAWQAVEGRLDRALANVRGVSFAEYRLLAAVAAAPRGRASRVALAEEVGMTPSGVTRALRPLEKIGLVATERDARDARRAIAELTPAGRRLLVDATAVVDDMMATILDRLPEVSRERARLTGLLRELARA